MDTIPHARQVVAVLAASAFGIAAPLTAASLAQAAVHGHGASHSRDWDGDKMPNRWEITHRLDAHTPNARRDADHDGSRNLAEFRDGTDPQDDDSDDDGVEDGDDDSPDGDCSDDDSRLQRHDGSNDCDDDADECDESADDSDDDVTTTSSDDDCDTTPAPTRLAWYLVA